MTKQLTLLFYCTLLCAPLFAQKTFQAPKLDQIPSLDGTMDDACWQKAGITEDFTTSTPVFGQQPAHPVSVRMFYADDALYIGATFGAEHLRDDGSARDAFAGDWFSVSFDTWNDDQHALLFAVTAGGAQIERQIAGADTETNWDAVWQSAVARRADGWSVEMRIPFTALRFPKVNMQNWGVQFTRYDINKGELCTWNPQNPLIGDNVLQYGNLEGLEHIHQAKRRKLIGYEHTVAYYKPQTKNSPKDKSAGLSLGLDGQFGFGSNATLDLSILPASSVNTSKNGNKAHWNLLQSGDVIPNAPRQFNAENALLFERSDIVWRSPQVYAQNMLPRAGYIGNNIYIQATQDSRLINAAKFSSRSRRNFGFGVYNAVMGPAGVVLRDRATGIEGKRTLQPISNYTLLTAEKVLRNNSWISLSNGTLLAGSMYRSNLSALDVQLRDRSNRYEFAGNGKLGFYETAPDSATYVPSYRFSMAKVNGAFVWRIAHSNQTGLGTEYDARRFIFNRFSQTLGLVEYRDYTPGRHYLSRNISLEAVKQYKAPTWLELRTALTTRRLYLFAAQLYGTLAGTTEHYLFQGNNNLERKVSPEVGAGLSFRSDIRKRFVCSIIGNFSRNIQGEKSYSNLSFIPSYVINPHFSIRLENRVYYTTGHLNTVSKAIPEYLFLQFNDLNINQIAEFNWNVNKRFRLYLQGNFINQFFSNQHIVKLSPDRNLTPFDYPFISFKNNRVWDATLGLEYWFAQGSQIRFSHRFKGHRDEFYNVFFGGYESRKGLQEMQTTLSIILLIDPANKRNFVGHE